MPNQVTKLKLFVASPGDVQKERDALARVIGELNLTTAPDRNLVLEVVRWETHVHPGIGEDPQAVVNRQIETYDVFVGIFWHRVGTKTQRAESGTIEEFEMARDLHQQGRLKHLLLYFKTTPWMPSTEDEAEQMRRLLAFRKSISGSVLVKEFKSTRAIEQTLRTDLSYVLKKWVAAESGSAASTGLPFTAIVAREVPAVAEAAVRLVPGNALPHKVISGGHSSPLSVRWASDTEVAFATRGGDVMVAAAGMEPRPIDLGGAVPSYVTAHGKHVATVKYTYLSLCSLDGGETKRVLFEEHAGGSIAEWSPSGEFLAAAGTNIIKVYRADLTEVAAHHVGGKYGSSAIAWAGDILWAGLHNGELWRVKPPYDHPEQVMKREGASCLALRTATASDRVACYWYDGKVEIRENGTVVAEVLTEAQSKWTAHGPKLAWSLNDSVVAFASGLDSEVLFWNVGSGGVLRCAMERDVEALDTKGTLMALGIGEMNRNVNGEVWLVDLADLPALFAEPAGPEGNPAHLVHADWTPLLDAIEDARGKGTEPDISKLQLTIEPVEQEFVEAEGRLARADAEPGIIREISKRVRAQRRHVGEILPELAWLGRQLREAGHHEREIVPCLDAAASFAANRILGELGKAGYPAAGDLPHLAAFTHGCSRRDLVSLGFDTADGRGMTAEVPVRFLARVSELARMGRDAALEHGSANPSEREIVHIAAQLFHTFDLVFDWNNQRELWLRYVLPQAINRYPREMVVVNHSEIDRFGLA